MPMASSGTLRKMRLESLDGALRRQGIDRAVVMTIVVAALGYFVDVFDLLLFTIVRVPSLKELGYADAALLSKGVWLINIQMAGLLLGGILWGVMGDKVGRKSVLFGSIALYSLANIANGFVHNIELYAALRFIAGIGLAGELGAGVTLASELLPRGWRGYGTTFISAIGVLGAAAGVAVADMTDWRTAYIIGGVMGLALLALRVNVRESALYQDVAAKAQHVARGDLSIFLRRPKLLFRLLLIVLVGAPLWGMVGMFITFTPEFAKDFGMTVIPSAGTAVLYAYLGIAVGGTASGLISQRLQSRRKTVMIHLAFLSLCVAAYLTLPYGASTALYYGACLMMGVGTGYWTIFIQMGAEHFGTNIRATAATTVPNFVRGLTIPITLGFRALIPSLGVTGSGATVIAVLIILAAASLRGLKETFHTDMNYIEDGAPLR